MTENAATVLEKIRMLIHPLSAEERLAVIRAIADADAGRTDAPGPAGRARTLADEQAAWYARPQSARTRYRGKYVAIRGGEVVDQDPDQRTLYLRVRRQFGADPVLIVGADWEEPPVYTIFSPRLE